MKYFFLLKKTIPFFFLVLLFSCASRKDMIYYQDIDNLGSQQKSNSYEIKIQPDDLLMISVYAEDPEIAKSFSLNVSTGLTSVASKGSVYLVDANGSIDFPTLGKMKVSGLTRTEVLDLLDAKISRYIKKPIISLSISNFKVSVQGEVGKPGTYPILSERITLIEALSMAGDLTVFGKRDNILIIREIDGVKSFNRVDITKAGFMNSPFYYLAQNDVVYVEPNQNKINVAAINPSTGLIFSVLSILFTLTTLIITTIK
ncbi:polysaccharide biosynthesis/export family protein [Flavobacterium caseinilyticum]|uniref:Polysaccharide export protein n=1 Tax=Flavobacterium caseinilyticum TaxID=2541732 RepID=A0A4R5AU59_9FLAO|nr:polysaccharide biosynthesis/export family protein [Flavobacterium caseinilyticum]TDD75945.1 polysaccharide export protein [Flavobacterium caseinilyticum]